MTSIVGKIKNIVYSIMFYALIGLAIGMGRITRYVVKFLEKRI